MRTAFATALVLGVTAVLCTNAVAQGTGSFRVGARWVDGQVIPNGSSRYLTVELIASGRWNHDPSSWYSYGPQGNGEVAPSNLRLPGHLGGRVGALIVRRGNGRFEHVGRRRTITLAPGERVWFMINDHPHGYGDNSGTIHVDWFAR
jgi:hypothetical protein